MNYEMDYSFVIEKNEFGGFKRDRRKKVRKGVEMRRWLVFVKIRAFFILAKLSQPISLFTNSAMVCGGFHGSVEPFV